MDPLDPKEWLELRESKENVDKLGLELKEREVSQDLQDVLDPQEWLETPSNSTLTSSPSILRPTK